jgi:uncharacterized protein YndB with AHSA1/START domain
MSLFASDLYRAVTQAPPERVWEALTTTGSPMPFLYGMAAETDWQPDHGLTMAAGDEWRLTGEVLAAEPFRRLSYTLGDRPGDPSVFVTWELRAVGSMTYVWLYVDEPQPRAGFGNDLEVIWLPVLCGLVAQLNQAATAG